MVMSKKLYGFLISILILLPILCMTTDSVQASPALIEANSEPGQTGDSGAAAAFAQEETAVPTGGLAGKIYLWVAFAAALIIFTAAVLGAILLYTRQRYKE